MNSVRAHRQWVAWVAILALLLSLLTPSVSHALGLAQGSPWVEVCTAQGSKWIQSDSGESPDTPATVHSLPHSACCSIHVPVLGWLPSLKVVESAFGLTDKRPLADRGELLIPLVWELAQPRAPPLYS